MRHRIKGKKFNRDTASRKALALGLMKSIIESEKVETTLPKAKFIRPKLEKLVTVAKNNTLAARRRLLQILGDKALVDKMLENLGPRFEKRPGGYLRIQKSSLRQGDRTQVAVISFVEEDKKPVKSKATEPKAEETKVKKEVVKADKPKASKSKPKKEIKK